MPESQGVQAWDRYAYANNSPTNFTDPSGHAISCGDGGDSNQACGGETGEYRYWKERQNLLSCQANGGANCPRSDAEIITFATVGLVTAAGGGMLVEGAADIMMSMGATASTTACADGDCLNEIEALGEGVQEGITVLGRYPSYINVAKDIGGKIFSVPTEVWNKMSTSEQWALNQQFLDEAIARGDTFYLASKWADATVGSFFRMELEYLFTKGYTLSVYQNYLIPPSP